MKKGYNFSDVYIMPKRTTIKTLKNINLNRNFNFKNSGRSWQGIPIVSSNSLSTGNARVYESLLKNDMMTIFNESIEHYPGNLNHDRSMYSCSSDYLKLLTDIGINKPNFVCFDHENGYFKDFQDSILEFKNTYPDITVCAGNIFTPNEVHRLINNCGVDIVKIGMGSNNISNIANKSGVGYPELTCIMECAEAAKSSDGYVMCDYDIKNCGDIGKAFAAGSDFVMLDNMLDGHDENGGKLININGIEYFISFSTLLNSKNIHLDNNEYVVKRKGLIQNTINNILENLRTTCCYLDCDSIEKLAHNSNFINVINN